jgi:hypothetical protein
VALIPILLYSQADDWEVSVSCRGSRRLGNIAEVKGFAVTGFGGCKEAVSGTDMVIR